MDATTNNEQAHTAGTATTDGPTVRFTGGRARLTAWVEWQGNMSATDSATEAIARRAAACWNAFDGIPTAQIEALGAGGVAELVAELREVRDQLLGYSAGPERDRGERLAALLARIGGGDA